MSLAGPYGEAACRYCNTLQDCRPDGKLVIHNVPPSRGARACPGSGEWMGGAPKEVESLAFRSEPVTRHCPGCGQLVTVNTIGASHRSGWRYQYHKMSPLKADYLQPEQDCPQSGQLVGHPKPPGADVQVQVSDGLLTFIGDLF